MGEESIKGQLFTWMFLHVLLPLLPPIAALYAVAFFRLPPLMSVAVAAIAISAVIIASVKYDDRIKNKILANIPVRMLVYTSHSEIEEITNAITRYKLVKEEKTGTVEIEEEDGTTRKIPTGKYVYEIEFMDPVEIGEDRFQKAVLLTEFPIDFILWRYSDVEIFLHGVIFSAPTAVLDCDYTYFETDDPQPVFAVVNSAFHTYLRHKLEGKVGVKEWNKEDLVDAAMATMENKALEWRSIAELLSQRIEVLTKRNMNYERDVWKAAAVLADAWDTNVFEAPLTVRIFSSGLLWKILAVFVGLGIVLWGLHFWGVIKWRSSVCSGMRMRRKSRRP